MTAEENIRVAVVENEALLCDYTFQALHVSGFEPIFKANDGLEMQKHMERCTQSPHVVLVDIRMPGMNGYRCCQWIREHYKRSHVIAFTGLEDLRVVQGMLRSGARGFLNKACSSEDIQKAVCTVHSGDYFQNAYLSRSQIREASEKRIPRGIEKITDHQLTFLEYVCQGLKGPEIESRMQIGKRAVEDLFDKMYTLFQINDKAGLATLCHKLGVIY